MKKNHRRTLTALFREAPGATLVGRNICLARNCGASETLTDPVNWIDRYIGHRLRQRRLNLGIGADHFSARLGIETDALAAIETGRRRLGVGLLRQASLWLDVPVSYFFDGLIDPSNMQQVH